MESEITTPFTITLTQMGDFLRLEKVLRHLLQCHGTTCSFLQSADYVSIKIAAAHALRGSLGLIYPPTTVYIPQSKLIMSLTDNNTTIVVRESDLEPIKTSQIVPKTKKRKCKHGDSEKKEAENDEEDKQEDFGDVVMESSGNLQDISVLESNFIKAKLAMNSTY
jgi:hypothetical protein